MPTRTPLHVLVLALTAALVAPLANASSAEHAAEHYLLHCSGCHRSDGRGVDGTTPSLHALAPLLASERGRAYLVRVPGVAQAPLDDADLAQLLNWIAETFSKTRPEPPYSAEEVGRGRRDPLRDPGTERRAILDE